MPEILPASAKTLDDIILPGTPPSVRRRYETLEERARLADFGPLEEDLVVLDTETTGLSFRKCELIQVSAARISGREVVDRLDTFVRPKGHIPPEITRLTHITEANVAGAPAATEAVAALASFVAGSPVLAHNAVFDRTFVTSVPGGREVTDTWIDTLALSRIALPRLSTHRLQDMASAFHQEGVTHRANDDVDALIGMWRIILLGLADLPRGLLAHLADMHPEVEWEYRPIVSHLAQEQGPAAFSLRDVRRELVREAALPDRPAEVAPDRTVGPSDEEVEAAFAPGGLVDGMYERYEERPEQVQMALEVAAALRTSTHRAVEAGTGTGKSMAYLVPSVLFAQRNHATVGVATKTNALTDQLMAHELPALAAALPNGVSFTSLKGYDHYPCPHRLDQAAGLGDLPLDQVDAQGRSRAGVESDMLTAIAVTYAFCCQSTEGDVDALGIRWRYVPRSLLTTTPDECLHQRCPYFPNECPLHASRRRAAQCDVVVTNHSLLLRDVDMDNAILPPISRWVVDEAHGFEGEARRQWAREVSGKVARAGFEHLGDSHTGVIRRAMEHTAGMDAQMLLLRLLTQLSASALRARQASEDVLDALHDLGRVAPRSGGYDTVTLWIDDRVRATPEWARLSEAGHALGGRLEEAEHDGQGAADALAQEDPSLAADLTAATRFMGELGESLRLILEGTDETYVYYAELASHRRDMVRERLAAEKIDVGAETAKRWLSQMRTVVFTSATIAVGDSFEHFDRAVGLSETGRCKDVKLPPSFDYERNMSVIVCHDMPQPSDPRYLDALEDLLFDVHVAMGGSTLTLFTNRREMERVYEGLAPRLEARGLELLCQERGSSPRHLREQFLADESRSLMALRSFWEGFDASGDTLRCVVIPKLPFASPNDPLSQERERHERNVWWRHSLPEAVISVKQAAGRLIRTSTDTGVLVLADSRVATKRYGAHFTSSLPNDHPTMLERDNVGRYIELWRRARE